MDRRLLITAFACWPLAGAAAEDEGQRPRFRISAGQLHKALSARFPVRLGLPGLLELEITAPSLHLLPRRNQLGATLQAQAGGPALRQIRHGELDVMFTPRYESADQTVRARDMEIVDLRLPGLPAETLQALRGLLPALAREVVGEVVLHRFSQRELAVADTLGFEPEQLTVAEDGLVVEFTRKRRP
ncbi:MAG TPA: DUF1439 domain-containing protein [Ramlibacter sp.]|nr:DUF1439 domain-containing protein [Ramlibacter sp.]